MKNKKHVGVCYVNATQKQGITLIALIITIIVMLILVAVSVSVAIQGGIFTKANESRMETEREKIYEEIVGEIEITNDGKIDVEETLGRIEEKYGEDNVNYSEPSLEIKGKYGTYNYKLTQEEFTRIAETQPIKTFSSDWLVVHMENEEDESGYGGDDEYSEYGEVDEIVLIYAGTSNKVVLDSDEIEASVCTLAPEAFDVDIRTRGRVFQL